MADKELWLVFRARLTTAMQKLGLNQKELAKQLGIAESTIHGWRKTGATPKGPLLVNLARTLSVTPDYLLPGSATAASPGDGKDVAAYVTGGLIVLDEMELALQTLRKRWEQQDALAKGAAASSDAVARAERAQARERERKRRSKGS